MKNGRSGVKSRGEDEGIVDVEELRSGWNQEDKPRYNDRTLSLAGRLSNPSSPEVHPEAPQSTESVIGSWAALQDPVGWLRCNFDEMASLATIWAGWILRSAH